VARQERAVDPLDGPLQAFAYDLRKVRADAGLPTYRALAKVAGFSATTLSEAAGGMRKPTLDVVLAYVGACHGDTDYWRCRWEALDDPAPQAGDPPVEETTAQRAPDPDEPPTLDDPVQPAPARRRRRWRIVVPVAATLSVAVAAGAFAMHRPARNGCPARPKHPAFTALSYGAGARVHSGAVRDAPVLTTVPAGCTLGFVGYCLGEKIHDNTGGTPDVRWFKLSDTEVVASGIVHGNPPPGLAPSHCPDDHPGPSAIRLTVNGDQLSATGRGLDIVGFAALYDRNGERRWRQIGFTEPTADHPGFTVRWKPVAAENLIIATAACLGGDGPTAEVSADSLLTTPEQAAAAAAACSYPP
jgi:hypothetical protein